MVKVEIFPNQNACGCSSGGDMGTENSDMRVLSLLKTMQSKGKDKVSIEVEDYSTQEGIDRAVTKLMQYLRAKGLDKAASMGVFALMYATPAVAVDEQLEFINRLPNEKELLEAIDRADN